MPNRRACSASGSAGRADQRRLERQLDPLCRGGPRPGISAKLDDPEPDLGSGAGLKLQAHCHLKLHRAQLELQLFAVSRAPSQVKLAAQLADHLS